MRTGRSKAEVTVFKDTNTADVPSRQMMKKSTSAIKTEAFGDKENAVEKTHAAVSGTELTKSKVIEPTIAETKDKFKRSAACVENTGEKKAQESISCEGKIEITADDLTNPAGPSENYWKLLSEQRRKALEAALSENQMLHQKCLILEAENETLKQALQEATEVISVLNEITDEDKETDETECEPKSEDSTSRTNSPLKEKPKSTESAFGNDSTVCDESDDSDKE